MEEQPAEREQEQVQEPKNDNVDPRFSDQDPSTDPSMWAISYEQLMEVHQLAKTLYDADTYPTVTMRSINERIIVPRCLEAGTSYALSLNPQGLKLDAFITHCWDEPFEEFVLSVQNACHSMYHKPNLWICAFALMQGPTPLIQQQIGLDTESQRDLSRTPFVEALKEAKLFVVVRNSATDLYSRIWCICELMFAIQEGLVPTKVHVVGPDGMFSKHTKSVDAVAYNPSDRDRILQVLTQDHSPEQIDKIVDDFRAHPAALVTGQETHQKLQQVRTRLAVVISIALVIVIVVVVVTLITLPSPEDQVFSDPNRTTLTGSDIENWATIPTKIGILTKLTILELPEQDLSGTIPSQLGLCTELRRIWLQDNHALTGTIPAQISSLQKLTSLSLKSNRFNGTLPTALTDLTNLQQLWLNYNSFGGTLSPELGLLTKLSDLNATRNHFHGTLPPLNSLRKLKKLGLAENHFQGTLPSDFGKLTRLEILDLYSNPLLKGITPLEWSSLTKLESLLLYNTSLTGDIPMGLCVNATKLRTIEIDCNGMLLCPESCRERCTCHGIPGPFSGPFSSPTPTLVPASHSSSSTALLPLNATMNPTSQTMPTSGPNATLSPSNGTLTPDN